MTKPYVVTPATPQQERIAHGFGQRNSDGTYTCYLSEAQAKKMQEKGLTITTAARRSQ